MIKVGITIDRWDFRDMATRGHNEAMKIIGKEVMSKYASGELFERFTSRAEQGKLHMAPRERWYIAAKIEKRGGGNGTMNHVWSGDTERAFHRRSELKITPKLWRILIHGLGPQYKRARVVKGGRIDLRSEIERISKEDVDAMKKHIEERYMEVLTSPQVLRRQRVKV